MIWCLLRWGQAILRCFGGHPIPVPGVLLGASGGAPGTTSLAYNPRSGAGVSHPSHNHRGTRTASALSLFWQECQPLPLAPLPRFHQTSSCPGALDSGLPPQHHHARQEMPWVAQPRACISLGVWGAWHHATLLLNHISAHVGRERPTHCHRQGWGWAGRAVCPFVGLCPAASPCSVVRAPCGGGQGCPC